MFKEILLPLDLTNRESQGKAVSVAVEQARLSGARLHVMLVVPDFGLSIVGSYFPEGFEKQAIEDSRAALHAFCAEAIPDDLPVQHIVAHGTIYREILRVAEEQRCDLIVMASHRPELRDYLLGPNAARVVRHAACSVLVVRD